jgi:hypothetical protein
LIYAKWNNAVTKVDIAAELGELANSVRFNSLTAQGSLMDASNLDFNNDGVINGADYMIVKKAAKAVPGYAAVLGRLAQSIKANFGKKRGNRISVMCLDLDGDGKINARDILFARAIQSGWRLSLTRSSILVTPR